MKKKMVMMLDWEYQKEMTVKDCVELFLSNCKDKSHNTYINYQNTLFNMSKNIFDKDLLKLDEDDISKLTWNTLERYKKELAKENKNTTVNNRLSIIKKFLRFTIPKIGANYDLSQLESVGKLRDDGDNTPMIPENLLIEYAEWFESKEKHQGREKRLITLFLYETGIRAESGLSVTKREFERDGDSYLLRTRDKGNKPITCKVGLELYNELMNLNPNSNKVFSLSYRTFHNAFSRANKHFEVKMKYSPHSIRKLAITNYYKITKCIESTRKFANHSSIEVTQRYLDIEEDFIDGAYTRRNSTNSDKYKHVDLETLVSVIDTLPSEIKNLINLRLEYKN